LTTLAAGCSTDCATIDGSQDYHGIRHWPAERTLYGRNAPASPDDFRLAAHNSCVAAQEVEEAAGLSKHNVGHYI
jgi:hypothetical protein